MDTQPLLVDGPISIARLHGRACFTCGAVTNRLQPAGTIIRPGSPRTWPIVTCGCAPIIRGRTTARRSLPARHCTYCPKPGADTCVRVHDDGSHVFAHRTCAAARGDTILYSSIEAPARPGETG